MKVLYPIKERVDPAIKAAIDKLIRSNPHIDLVALARQIGAAFSSVMPADIVDNLSDHDKLSLARNCGIEFQTGFKAAM
jgi:hypothetical protein